jgi:sec-independent protein translocase protein TatA
MANVGPGEILLLLLLALLLFGAKRLPEIGRSVGRGMREFKDAVSGIEEDERGVEPITVGRREDGQPAASAQDRQRFCSGCGAETQPDDRFCAKCGAALERPPAALAG